MDASGRVTILRVASAWLEDKENYCEYCEIPLIPLPPMLNEAAVVMKRDIAPD